MPPLLLRPCPFRTDYDAFDFQRYSTLHGFAEDLLLLLTELGVEVSLLPTALLHSDTD